MNIFPTTSPTGKNHEADLEHVEDLNIPSYLATPLRRFEWSGLENKHLSYLTWPTATMTQLRSTIHKIQNSTHYSYNTVVFTDIQDGKNLFDRKENGLSIPNLLLFIQAFTGCLLPHLRHEKGAWLTVFILNSQNYIDTKAYQGSWWCAAMGWQKEQQHWEQRQGVVQNSAAN